MLTPPPASKPQSPTALALRILALLGVLFLFFVSLELMGGGFKLMGRDFAENLFGENINNPLIMLFMGILATTLVQSSSTVTTLTVGLVVAGQLSVGSAIPVIMGANIGTTVTNTIVSMGHITRPEEFRRAMAGATVHDFFNWMAVIILLPLELAFKVLSKPAEALTSGAGGIHAEKLFSPVKELTKPVATFIKEQLLFEQGILVLIVGLALLFLALRYLVVLLKALILGRAEGFMHKYIFGKPAFAMLAGVALTIFVQSSSVTTSLVIPLVGAGIVTVRQIFPYTLGSNVGTTITALIAALAFAAGAVGPDEVNEAVNGLQIAFVHVLFNVVGIILIYPIPFLREIPIKLAEFVGDLAFKNRFYAIAYLVGLFYGLPLLLYFIF